MSQITQLLESLRIPTSQASRAASEKTYSSLSQEKPVDLADALLAHMDPANPANSEGIRAFAAVLCRTHVNKNNKDFMSLPSSSRYLTLALQYFSAEPIPYCSRRLSHLAAQLTQSLPEHTNAVQFVLSSVGEVVSSKGDHFESSMFLLDKVAEYCPSNVWSKECKEGVVKLIQMSLAHVTSIPSATPGLLCSTIVALSSIGKASAAGESDESASLGSITLSPLLQTLSTLLQTNDAQNITTSFQSLVDLATSAPNFFSLSSASSLSDTISACLMTAQATSLNTTNRLLACQLVATLTSTARKQLLGNQKCLQLCLDTNGITTILIQLIHMATDDDVDSWAEDELQAFGDDFGYEGDEDSLAAESYLEAIIHDLSGTKAFPIILPIVNQLLGDQNDWKSRRCGLAVLERCLVAAPAAFNKHLANATNACVHSLTNDSNVRVHWAALQLIGSLCNENTKSYKSVVFGESGGRVLGAVCSVLQSVCNKVKAHGCGALISFCRGGADERDEEVLEQAKSVLSMYLRDVLNSLKAGPLSENTTVNEGGDAVVVCTNGILALSCVAGVAGEQFTPYYAEFMPSILSIITQGLNEEGQPVGPSALNPEMLQLRGAAIECASFLGEAVGKDSGLFMGDATNIMNFVMKLFSTYNHQLQQIQAQTKSAEGSGNTNDFSNSVTSPVPLDKVHNACARVCRIVGSEFVNFLPAILPALLKQAKQKSDVEITDGTEKDLMASKMGEPQRDLLMGTESMTMELPGQGIKKLTINTTVMEEKSEAARAIYEHAAALGADFGPFAKVCSTTLLPLVGFKYSANVRSTAATALQPVFEAACTFAKGDGNKQPNQHQINLPNQLLGPLVTAILKQLEQEKSDTETLITLCESLSDITSSAFSFLFNDEPGKHVAKLGLEDAHSLVSKVLAVISDCLDRRSKLVKGKMEPGIDEDEYLEYDQSLIVEGELLTPCVDAIGYTLKSGIVGFEGIFECLLAPFFGKVLQSSHCADIKARFVAICCFDDCVEYLGAAMAAKYAPALLPACVENFEEGINGGDLELKQAAVYGIAQIVRKTPGVISEAQAKYIIPRLVNIIRTAVSEEELMFKENAVSALASMCVFRKAPFANIAGGDLPHLKKMVVSNFPLTEDQTEAHLCHEMFADMVEIGDKDVCSGEEGMANVLRIFAKVLKGVEDGDSLAGEGTCARFAGLLSKHQNQMMGGWGVLSYEEQMAVQKAMTGDADRRGVHQITP